MNIFFNVKFSHLKFFIKSKKNLVYSIPARNFTELYGCHLKILKDSKGRKKKLNLENIRCLSIFLQNLNRENLNGYGTEKKKDNSLIYYGALAAKIKGLKIFSCLTSIGGIAVQPVIVQHILTGKDVVLASGFFSIVGFFSYVTPILIHSFAKKYVIEIWYNSVTETYTATVLSFFLRRINISFKIEDVEVPTLPSIFYTMKIKGKPLYIISESFVEMEHYIKMMRYDKPLDLKLDEKF